MFDFPVATTTTLIPIIGSLFIASIDKNNIYGIKSASFWTSLFVFAFSFFVVCMFGQPNDALYQDKIWFLSNNFSINKLGVDWLSAIFVVVISFITFSCVLWLMQKKNGIGKDYFIPILLLEAFSIGAFYSRDIILMYIFIEATIIPIFMIMSSKRIPANTTIFQYLLYTITGAFLILLAIIMIYSETGTLNLSRICEIGIKNKAVFWLLVLGIGIKMPIWPFYHWLPSAHVKSQTVCSVLLASVVLKFATLLILRLVIPLFSDILIDNKDIVICILMIGAIFALSQMFFQDDLKAVFAYFSIIHLNLFFIILLVGMPHKYFIFTILYHSFLMALLFFAADIIKSAFGTRSIEKLRTNPTKFYSIRGVLLPTFLVLIAVPFSWGFVAEITSIYATSKVSVIYASIVAVIILLSSFYAMYIYNLCFCNVKTTETSEFKEVHEADACKMFVLYSILAAMLVFGLYPGLLLR